jgi:hypothetical protein
MPIRFKIVHHGWKAFVPPQPKSHRKGHASIAHRKRTRPNQPSTNPALAAFNFVILDWAEDRIGKRLFSRSTTRTSRGFTDSQGSRCGKLPDDGP